MPSDYAGLGKERCCSTGPAAFALNRSPTLWRESLIATDRTPFGATGVVLQIVPARSSDLNADSLVNGVDLAMLLSQWTGTGQLESCPPLTDGDLNVDCRVNGIDLARLLSEWKRK